MTTIKAMKQIRDKLIAGDLLCEVVAVSMLDEAIAAEEAQTVEPVRFRCVQCKLPLPGGYSCACGSDEAEEDLCEDEGCPQHGTDHVCTNPLGPVPQGWKLVPIEPTSGMRAQIPGNITFGEWVTQYKAMLSAAPQPPQADEPCYCDKNGLGKPGVSCGDCPTRDYKQDNSDERANAPRKSGDAHEIWAAAQLTPGECIEDGVARVEALLDAPRVPMSKQWENTEATRQHGEVDEP